MFWVCLKFLENIKEINVEGVEGERGSENKRGGLRGVTCSNSVGF